MTPSFDSAAAVPVDPARPPIPGAVPLSLDEMRPLPFLRELSDATLLSLQPGMWQRTFAAQERVLRTGEYGDAAYFILNGFAEVRLTGISPIPRAPDAPPGWFPKLRRAFAKPGDAADRARADAAITPDGTIVLSDPPVDVRVGYQTRMQAGEIFGEVSALSRFPHAVDVVALTELHCVVLPTPVLRRLRDEVETFDDMIEELYVERTLDVHLARVDLFAGLPEEIRKAIRANAVLIKRQPDQRIATQGEPCEAFYLVRGGYVKVTVQDGDRELAVTYLRKGDYAGEIGLLLDEPWAMSLTALEHVELVEVRREDLRRALADSPRVEQELWTATVERLKDRGFALRNPKAVQSLKRAMDTGVIHGESVLLIDLNTCTKCDDCVRACADTHDGTPRFVREGIRLAHYSVPTACYQCTDPVCMIGCPTGAISRPFGTLQVTINKDTCIGCHVCVNNCPWHNIVPVPYHSPSGRDFELATKCDLCIGRAAGPACVQMCPHGSAVRVDLKDPLVVRTLFA